MFGRELRKARKSARLTQDQLARRVEELTGKNRRARGHKKSPTASTVGLRGHALTGQGKENKEIRIYSTCPKLSNFV